LKKPPLWSEQRLNRTTAAVPSETGSSVKAPSQLERDSIREQFELMPPLTEPPPMMRANAVIGAALHAPLRGRFLLVVRGLWLALVAVTIGLFVLTIPTRYDYLVIEGAENSIALGELGLAPNTFALMIGAFDAITFIAYTAVGALIFLRKSHEWIGLVASLTLITAVFALVRPFDSLLFVETYLRAPLLMVLGLAGIAIVIFVYSFPDGHFEPRWMRLFVILTCAVIVGSMVYRLGWVGPPMQWPPAPLTPFVFVVIFVGAIDLLYRYRRVSDGQQREQMRWVVFSVAIGALGLLGYFVVLPALFPRVLLPGMARVIYLLIAAPLFYLALIQLPIALAFSILRYHLWDIDFIISRTLIYFLLTAILAGLFAAFETIMQNVFVLLTGQESDIATVISTLVVVAAFTPVKDLVSRFVERRFKDEPDASIELKAFGELVETRVSPVHPPQLARRFLAESMSAFDARGGAVYLHQKNAERMVHTVGDWNGKASVVALITTSDDALPFGWIALTTRAEDEIYSEQDLKALDDVTRKIAIALEQDADADRD
jgi:hypothetical protein